MKLNDLLVLCLVCATRVFGGAAPPKERLVCSFTETRCLGQCAAYLLEVYANGNACYHGAYCVERLGRWLAPFTPSELEKLVHHFHTYDFFSLEDRYYQEIKDVPTAYLYFGTEEKKGKDFYAAPASPKKPERKVETWIERLSWVRQKVE